MTIMVLDFKQTFDNGTAVDWVLIGPRGEAIERTQTWHRISKIRPPENGNVESLSYAAMKSRWDEIEPHYEAWKSGHELPESGTPLGAWPGVNTAQAEILKKMGFTTVESITSMTESDVAKLPFPNARKIPQMAREFVEGKDISDLQAQNEALAEKLAALEEALNAQQEKPRRGRPPKAKADEAA